MARIARKFNSRITPHNTQTGAAGAKILHFAAAIPNVGDHMEYPWRSPQKAESWYSPNLVIRNGAISVPTGPGFGIEYDPKYLAAARPVTP